MRISDWSSDVCSSDLLRPAGNGGGALAESTARPRTIMRRASIRTGEDHHGCQRRGIAEEPRDQAERKDRHHRIVNGYDVRMVWFLPLRDARDLIFEPILIRGQSNHDGNHFARPRARGV